MIFDERWIDLLFVLRKVLKSIRKINRGAGLEGKTNFGTKDYVTHFSFVVVGAK